MNTNENQSKENSAHHWNVFTFGLWGEGGSYFFCLLGNWAWWISFTLFGLVAHSLILHPLMSTSFKLFEALCKQYASRTALGSSNSTTSRKISRCKGQIVIRLLRKRIRDRKIEESKSSCRRLSGSALNSHFSTNDPCWWIKVEIDNFTSEVDAMLSRRKKTFHMGGVGKTW